MFDLIEKRLDELYERLDNLEGCEDNPVYAAEIIEIRNSILELQSMIATELF